MDKKITKSDVLNDPDFQELASKKNSISITLTIAELILYFGFIGLIAFNKPFLASKITSTMTIGIPIAVGTIILSWVLTGIYVRWANNKYDAMVARVKDKIGG